jgi:hypothetical protein
MSEPSPVPDVRTEPAPPDAMPGAPDDLQEQVAAVRRAVAALEGRFAGLETGVEGLSRQVGFLPPQVRGLGTKIDGLTTSVGETRCRALLLGLLGVSDLLDRIIQSPAVSSAPDSEHHRNYQVLRTQLRQLLEANGLTEVPVEGPFDPALHRALQTRPCADPAMANRVLEVVTPGFRTEQAVLRYAEVVVGQFVAPAAETPPTKNDQADSV